MNKFIITGNTTKDLEIKKTNNGNQYITISLAVNTKTKDKEVVNFYNIIHWSDKTHLVQYVGKGSHILVEGRLSTTKDGDFEKIMLVGDKVEFLNLKEPTNKEQVEEDDFPF